MRGKGGGGSRREGIPGRSGSASPAEPDVRRPASGPGSGAMKKDVRILLVGERECGKGRAGPGAGRGPLG